MSDDARDRRNKAYVYRGAAVLVLGPFCILAIPFIFVFALVGWIATKAGAFSDPIE